MRRAWLCLLGCPLLGCQLLIGDIELSGVESADAAAHADAAALDAAALDAAADGAAPVDAAPTGDAQGLDAAVVALDAAPDATEPPVMDAALPDAAPTPVDPTTLAGTWHLYGLQGRQRQVSMFVAALRVDADGTAIVTDLGSDAPLSDAATPFGPHPDQPNLLSVNLFPVAGLLIGNLDPVGGVGILVNDQARMSTQPIFVVLVRQQAAAQWPTETLYVRQEHRPVGGGELGDLVARGGAYQARGRVIFGQPPTAGPDQDVELAPAPLDRIIATSAADAVHSTLTLSAVGGGAGEVERDGQRVGLVMAWPGGGQVASAHRYFCGGPYFDANNALAVARAGARMEPQADGLALTFSDGRVAQLRPWQGDLLQVESQVGLFRRAGGTAVVGPAGRVVFLADGTPTGGLGQWASGLCVTLPE